MNPTPTADSLYSLFPDSDDRSEMVPVSPDEMPQPYRQLLVHTHHMTVTVEGHYGQSVDVKVLESVQGERDYGRKILLTLRETGDVVQFGIIDVDLDALSDSVRREIVAGRTPLGRVLIQHDVLRSIHPVGFFRVLPSAKLCEWFGLQQPQVTYGRLGVIVTGERPAIQVLEILAPIPDL